MARSVIQKRQSGPDPAAPDFTLFNPGYARWVPSGRMDRRVKPGGDDL